MFSEELDLEEDWSVETNKACSTIGTGTDFNPRENLSVPNMSLA